MSLIPYLQPGRRSCRSCMLFEGGVSVLCSRMWLVILRNFLRMQLHKRAKGLRVYGSGLEVWCSKLGVRDFCFRVRGSGWIVPPTREKSPNVVNVLV